MAGDVSYLHCSLFSFWHNVGAALNASDDLWRTATANGGHFEGGYVAWRDMARQGWNVSEARMHATVRAPFIWQAQTRKLLGFDNQQSMREKVDYAVDK